MTAILHTGDAERGTLWQAIVARELPDIDFRCWPDVGDPEDIRYLIAWTLDRDLVEKLPNLEILFSIGAGVDQLDLSILPPHVRVVRMIESGITNTMAEYVAMAALTLHRDLPTYIARQRQGVWEPEDVLLCSERTVGVMGLGELGRASIAKLAPLGFRLLGWSRSRTDISGAACFAGPYEFDAFLAQCDILVCLLPLTDDTRGILCRDFFERMPRGSSLINVARGGHLVQEDLIEALDSGQLRYAMLDVAIPEPLPAGHAFYDHPGIFLTPHVAGVTRKETAVFSLIANLQREAEGTSLVGEIDRARGY
ncbi:glyoxylate/hydroxypyruvate reductase A [Croceicoccus ponticola]|uniref:Glyoxylate/hydroxypyruvate reductase A n=1 Tax=Croceicoccus ponticola TaxID=2217664 RepID=A0A437H0H0_9SPHN|nr:glyoxylate/hydroxypyruvate reductase A [Croceicoccus ponticola]RVQ69144.1 glyoxylate/hydroxypyruvate reductase A [Croceicoccus ponticola]